MKKSSITKPTLESIAATLNTHTELFQKIDEKMAQGFEIVHAKIDLVEKNLKEEIVERFGHLDSKIMRFGEHKAEKVDIKDIDKRLRKVELKVGIHA